MTPAATVIPYATELRQQLLNLQRDAARYGELATRDDQLTETLVVYVTGVSFPWRLLETQARVVDDVTQRYRRLHCFDSSKKLRACLLERIVWRQADARLVRDYGQGRAAMPAGPSVSIEDARDRLREQMVRTRPDLTRVLKAAVA